MGGLIGIIIFYLEKSNVFIVDNLGILLLAIIPLERLIERFIKVFLEKEIILNLRQYLLDSVFLIKTIL